MLGNDFGPKAKSITAIYLTVAAGRRKGWVEALFFFGLVLSGEEIPEKINDGIDQFAECGFVTHSCRFLGIRFSSSGFKAR
jgi:hypothetical protein